MERMTSNEYNPCFNCNFYSSCSHIRENFPVCPERARYDRLAAIEDILGDEYDLDRLRELARADKEGRIRILSAGKGKSCGTCANFQPVPGHKCGDCKARKYFRASQSRRACSMYIGKDGNYAD